ncbi:sensor histidine kinase KdpD [Novosphingobium sp. 9U]|uniref:sensor histidine kinase n=1 Tax=Novosphingobium sp. 9U TaxID=2653158 RepID=UPI00135AA158|nr:HAMP domain-containing sensor histidine kinase [Novosphingobium sp. 9U]
MKAGHADPAPGHLLEEIARLREAVAARDAFIAVAAHELRNPMTPIRGQIDVLLRSMRSGAYAPERVQHGLERLEWLIERYMRRATTLLDVSRATTGKLRLVPQPVHLASLIREVVSSLTPLASFAGSVFTVEVPDCIEGSWDRLALEQILENLTSNAIKYGEGKPILVSAELQGGTAVVHVRDLGPGISEADQARIFERFERAVDLSKQGMGFGVGLWIVRQLAQAMGGEIGVDCSLGQGSTFTVSLPLEPGNQG